MTEYVVEFIGGPNDRWHRWAVRSDERGVADVVAGLLGRVHAIRVHRGDLDNTREQAALETRQKAGVSE